VFAVNRLYQGGKFTMSGTYVTNQAKGGGGGVYSVTNEAYGMMRGFFYD
jgi:hypothetical protein